MKRYVSQQSRVAGFAYMVTICSLLVLLSGCGTSKEADIPSATHPTVILPLSTKVPEEPAPESVPTAMLLPSSTIPLSPMETTAETPKSSNATCQLEIQEEKGDFQLGYPLIYLAEDGKGLFKIDQPGNFQHWLLLTGYATFHSLSPDGNWLVYRRDAEIVVVTNDRREEFVYPWQEAWTELWGWVSPAKIAIRHERELDTDLFVVYSPFTDPPDIETLELPWQFIPEFNNPVAYSPDFSLVLHRKESSIAVSDIYTSQSLWEKSVVNQAVTAVLGGGAAWSPDSQFISLGLPVGGMRDRPANELTILTRDGDMVFQTDYHKTYAAFTIRNPKWSRDGRYLSFWLIIPDAENHPLQIYDTLSKEFLDVCLTNDSSPGAYEWSPDSRQIAYLTNFNHLAVYDLQSKRAVLLAKNVLRLTGWIDQKE